MLYPDFIFFATGKCVGKPINKGLNAHFRAWKIFEVRYQVAKKNGFRVVHVVSLQRLNRC